LDFFACRKKRYATAGAIKTLDYVLQDHVANCELFVDIKGLKTAFSLFVARQKSKDKKSGVGRQREEHIVSILAQLFLNLSETRYLRLLRKFQVAPPIDLSFRSLGRLLCRLARPLGAFVCRTTPTKPPKKASQSPINASNRRRTTCKRSTGC